jgi:tRNA(Ile)-lysidine synthase
MPGKKLTAKSARTLRSRLHEQLLSALQRQGMVRAGDRVGVAVSGGADSVALLLLLLELREKLGIVLSVAHFNHKLRGRASDTDEKFVAKLAAKYNLEFHCASLDVAKKARKERANLEDAARRARYDYFRWLADSGACARIAVAHTADDQAETVLAHLLRGTGLAGLGGIHPTAGPVVRPLLSTRRSELRAFLRDRKQAWREDRTNRDVTRMRARIRTKLLPLLEKQFQPAIVEHLATLADLAREDEASLQSQAELRVLALGEETQGAVRILARDIARPKSGTRSHQETDRDNEHIATCSAAIRKRMVRQLIASIKRRPGQLGANHVDAVIELARSGQSGTSLSLPGGVEVRKERDTLIFRTAENANHVATRQTAREFEFVIDLDRGSQDVRVPELCCAFRFRVIDWSSERGETNKRETVLDRDRLRSPLVLRNWRPGDRFRPLGHRSAHKLKRFLNEKHISRWERDGWPVLTSGGVLAWARGFPAAAEFAADERTRAGILIVEEPI